MIELIRRKTIERTYTEDRLAAVVRELSLKLQGKLDASQNGEILVPRLKWISNAQGYDFNNGDPYNARLFLHARYFRDGNIGVERRGVQLDDTEEERIIGSELSRAVIRPSTDELLSFFSGTRAENVRGPVPPQGSQRDQYLFDYAEVTTMKPVTNLKKRILGIGNMDMLLEDMQCWWENEPESDLVGAPML